MSLHDCLATCRSAAWRQHGVASIQGVCRELDVRAGGDGTAYAAMEDFLPRLPGVATAFGSRTRRPLRTHDTETAGEELRITTARGVFEHAVGRYRPGRTGIGWFPGSN